MDFVTPIITPIITSLLVPVKTHLGFLVSSSIYVREMHAKITVLDGAKHDVHTKQVINEANNLVVPHYVPKWLAEVKSMMDTAKSIPTGGVGCFNMKMRYKAGKQASDIIMVIERLMREKLAMAWNDETIPLGMVTSPRTSAIHVDSYHQNENDIPSRDWIYKNALKFLEPNNNKSQMMAICGMAGVGKTTMMEKLEKVARDRRIFDWIVKVGVGQNPNPLVVQQTIAEYIRDALTETNKDTRAEHLQKRFMGMSEEGKRKILVILDDVWEEFNLKDIGLVTPLPNGLKVLLTSRDEGVCTRMGVEASLIFKMVVLEEPEAKKLFWKIIDGDDTEQDLHEIGEDIVKRCVGLPIAIKTIASTLRDIKDKNEWKDALFRLQNKDFEVINIFSFSYKNLKEDDLKAIFLLSGLFPEDYNIVIEDLLMYGWGLNFFKNLHTIAIARRRVITCVNRLIRANLLIKSDNEGCVKMHDLVRDFVLSNFSEVKQASIENYDKIISEELKEDESALDRILLKCRGIIEFPIDFEYPNLTLLKLMDGEKRLKFPKDFYTKMEKLKVAAYDNMYLHLLPQPSTKLRTLSLRSCSLIDDISFLGDLVNLEVLSLVNCGIHKLPSKIGKLKKLKLLDLTGCRGLSVDDGVFNNLENLEELCMKTSNSGPKFTDANREELKKLVRKLSTLEVELDWYNAQPLYLSFEKLERFRISVGSSLTWVDDTYSLKNTLILETRCEEIAEWGINELFTKTEILYLKVKDMMHLKDILIHPPQHSFCNLKALHVSGCSNLTCLFPVHVAKCLRKLESLEIKYCDCLKEIWSCEFISCEEEVNYISMLRRIEVSSCNNIVNLFPSNPMRLLSHLDELTVSYCNSVEALFNIDLGTIKKHGSGNSSLRIIKVSSLRNLREVWRIKGDEDNNYSGLLISGFQAVESLDIEDCVRFGNIVTPTTTKFDVTALKEISISNASKYVKREIYMINNSEEGDNMLALPFPSSLTHNLERVRKIQLNKHPRMKMVFEIESPSNTGDELVTTQKVLLPYLEHVELEEMNMLSHVWKCSNWTKFVVHQSQPSSFQNLTTIRLRSCQSIKYLFSPYMIKLLSNLKKVKISYCEKMEEVISNRDDENKDEEMTSPDTTTILFPHLDILDLSLLGSLKHIGGGVAKYITNSTRVRFSWSLCQYSTTINIWHCDALSSVIPYCSAGRMQNLQVLTIGHCKSMMEVFVTTEININNTSGCSNSTLANMIPRSILVHKFPNLRILHIYNCDCLEYIFMFSTLKSLTRLEKLTIEDCKSMKVIVKEGYIEQTTTCSEDVIFPNLHLIKLESLPKLSGFFLGMNINFHWPLLNDVTIKYCPQMLAFTYGRSTAPILKHIHTELGKHNPECCFNSTTPSSSSLNVDPTISEGRPRSFHSLIECNLKGHNLSKVFPSNEIKQLQKLEKIDIRRCDDVEEVFEVALEVTNNDSQTVVKFPKLRDMNFFILPKLKSIWKSNPCRTLEFRNLTRMSIYECGSLEHVFTFPMIGCVMQLQELHIRYCSNMKVVLEEEEDCDAKFSVISFPCLKSIELSSNGHLKGFCLGNEDITFPSLDTLEIKGCSQLSVFTQGCSTTPKLTTMVTDFGSFNGGEDINSFIMTKKELTPSASSDSEGRPLNLQSLIKCNPCSYDSNTKIFASNELQQLQRLETVYVHMCSCVEEVFEVTNNDSSPTVTKFPKLREVDLIYLPRFQFIWKSNNSNILEFPNLTRLNIDRCVRLKHVFTCSMVGCVMQLQELRIDKCRNMETIVKEEEEEEDCDAKFSDVCFPCLKSLEISNNYGLKGFCLGKVDFTFPSLDTLAIESCSQMSIFTRGHSVTPKLTIAELRNWRGSASYVVGEDINTFIMTKKQLGYI